MNKLALFSATDVQQSLCEWLHKRRLSLKLSRATLAELSTVPAPTIKKFETTHQISLRQFLLLWQSLDDLSRLNALTQKSSQATNESPLTIEDVLKG